MRLAMLTTLTNYKQLPTTIRVVGKEQHMDSSMWERMLQKFHLNWFCNCFFLLLFFVCLVMFFFFLHDLDNLKNTLCELNMLKWNCLAAPPYRRQTTEIHLDDNLHKLNLMTAWSGDQFSVKYNSGIKIVCSIEAQQLFTATVPSEAISSERDSPASSLSRNHTHRLPPLLVQGDTLVLLRKHHHSRMQT